MRKRILYISNETVKDTVFNEPIMLGDNAKLLNCKFKWTVLVKGENVSIKNCEFPG